MAWEIIENQPDNIDELEHLIELTEKLLDEEKDIIEDQTDDKDELNRLIERRDRLY